jgi:hypothetical protein
MSNPSTLSSSARSDVDSQQGLTTVSRRRATGKKCAGWKLYHARRTSSRQATADGSCYQDVEGDGRRLNRQKTSDFDTDCPSAIEASLMPLLKTLNTNSLDDRDQNESREGGSGGNHIRAFRASGTGPSKGVRPQAPIQAGVARKLRKRRIAIPRTAVPTKPPQTLPPALRRRSPPD